MSLVNHLVHTNTPQTFPLFGRTDQVKNSAGGFVFGVSPEIRLTRFLILGTMGGTYYATEKDLTIENANEVKTSFATLGVRAVELIKEISCAKPARAPKNGPCVLALAIGTVFGDESVKNAAWAALPDVCRIPTDLFAFIDAYQKLGGGWGRRAKRGVANWYQSKSSNLAYTTTKYMNRNGWSHRDLLRLAHITPWSPESQQIFAYLVKGELTPETTEVTEYLRVVGESLRGELSEADLLKNIKEHRLPREVLNTKYLNSPLVWESLLETMPVGAMIRNLGKMTSIGLLNPLSSGERMVLGHLTQEKIVGARMHPLSILSAQKIYGLGHGIKGGLSWQPNASIVSALDRAFVSAFGGIEPTGKRTLIALDVSSSMTYGQIAGLHLTPREASAAMAMSAVRTEPQCHVVGFASTLIQLPFINSSTSLREVNAGINRISFGSTDCSAPFTYATANKLEVDMFQVYTDNETYAGKIHPSVALQQYREKTGINAKLVVNGMTATNFTIADPKDPGMMDVVGADTSLPNIIREFSQW